MIESKYRAMEYLAESLGFTEKQMDLVGRCITLAEKKDGVIDYLGKLEYTDTHMRAYAVPIFQTKREGLNRISIGFNLESSLEKLSNEVIIDRIKKVLQEVGLPSEGLFAYCKGSCGLEIEDANMDLHFGFSYRKEERPKLARR